MINIRCEYRIHGYFVKMQLLILSMLTIMYANLQITSLSLFAPIYVLINNCSLRFIESIFLAFLFVILMMISLTNHYLNNYQVNNWKSDDAYSLRHTVQKADRWLSAFLAIGMVWWAVRFGCNPAHVVALFVYVCFVWFFICKYWQTNPKFTSWVHGIGLHVIPCIAFVWISRDCQGCMNLKSSS